MDPIKGEWKHRAGEAVSFLLSITSMTASKFAEYPTCSRSTSVLEEKCLQCSRS